MKRIILSVLLAVTATSLSSCATTHLWRWGMGKTSAVHTVKDDTVRAFVQPTTTIVGTPIAMAWDVATLPFQLIFQIYPYFGQEFMAPAERR